VALQSAKKEKNILLTTNEVGLMELRRNCHKFQVIAGKLGAGKRGRRSKQLLPYTSGYCRKARGGETRKKKYAATG
jgi:hypothetical protein